MKAGVASENGLVVRDVPQPRPKPNEVLVKVRAASLNRADLTTARGLPHGSHGGVGAPVGIDWAGEVVETGAEVQGGFKPGDRVMCSGNGGYAEYAVSDWGRVNPMPDGMSFEQAATLPVALITLHNALVTAGRLKAGESVMIQGASSGVGLMGLQIAKLKGAKLVIGTSTNDARRARLKEFGADLAIDTRDPAWPDAGAQGDRRQGRRSRGRYALGAGGGADHEGDGAARPHRQCRPARRHQGRVRLRPACAAPHRLYRRDLPHPHVSTRCARSAAACAPISGTR